MKQQTAVEWLIEKLYNASAGSTALTYKEIIVQAKEMEKKQLQEMYLKGIENYDTTFKRK